MTIAIFRHTATEGPGTIADFLDERGISYQLICIDKGEAVPVTASAYSGLVFMGGSMSVNDDLPWIPQVLALIRSAVEQDVPVLGHCLGGQLMAKALGGVVTRNPVKEIGWGEVTVSDNAQARAWFGEISTFDSFHWHGETFSLPPDAGARRAVPLLSSAHCANQAFAWGKHLAMQCHVEMTGAMIKKWCEIGVDEISTSASSPAVQSIPVMQAQTAAKLPQLRTVARRLYQHWLTGLARN